MLEKKIIPSLLVESWSSEGYGIAKYEGKVIMIENALPGDTVDALIFKNKKTYALGKIHQIHSPSNKRVNPYCSHYNHCGGCTLQHVDYNSQLELKKEVVINAYTHLHPIDLDFEVPDVLPCPKHTHYRNKLEYTFANKRYLTNEPNQSPENALGFHVRNCFDKVLHIDNCYHQENLSNEIRNTLYQYAIEKNISFYDLKQHRGDLRNLIIRNTSTNQWMVIVVFAQQNMKLIETTMAYLSNHFPIVNSWQYCVNEKKNDTLFDQDIMVYKGESYITEKLGSITCNIKAKSFFQVNIYHTENLYKVVKSMILKHKPNAKVLYDLYCGTGSIGLYLHSILEKIVGIDIIPEAIDDAANNAKANKIENAFYSHGDIKDVFNQAFYNTYGKADIIVLDPPRAGLHPNVIKQLLHIQCDSIIYISCNVATQARDISMLSDNYKIVDMQAVDMFPQTMHLENVCLLQLK